jgi:hypothetical protein
MGSAHGRIGRAGATLLGGFSFAPIRLSRWP